MPMLWRMQEVVNRESCIRGARYAGRALSSLRVLVTNQNASNAGIKMAVGVLFGSPDSLAILIAPSAAFETL